MFKIESNYFCFHPATADRFQGITILRSNETKIGQNISYSKKTNTTRYVLLGIEESFGPQANKGNSGAEHGFMAFLYRFLNMQSNRFLLGNEVLFIGTISQKQAASNPDNLQEIVSELDVLVENTLKEYIQEGFIPIVIGGGHNNAFPLIKSVAESKKDSIDVINLDPHADCRAMEGRHSGNSFSYAKNAGFLNHYSVIGLHKGYNSEYILNYLDEQNFSYTFFEDYIEQPKQFETDLNTIIQNRSESKWFGLELDLDCIQFMPSSAYTPSGFSVENARNYIRKLAHHKKCAYLHLPEGAPANMQEEKIVGKTLAYLVWDFITINNR
jgi:formiminoglutamase